MNPGKLLNTEGRYMRASCDSSGESRKERVVGRNCAETYKTFKATFKIKQKAQNRQHSLKY